MDIVIAKIIQVIILILSPFLAIYFWKSLKKATWYYLYVHKPDKGESYGRSDKGDCKRKG